jgi:hypothetical protein
MYHLVDFTPVKSMDKLVCINGRYRLRSEVGFGSFGKFKAVAHVIPLVFDL